MAQIKTVTTTSGENTITFDSFYPFVWIRNSGDNDITATNYSGASAGDENTVSIKAGEVAMIQAETENVYIIGATTVEVHAQGFADCPFKVKSKGGESFLGKTTTVLTDGSTTNPIIVNGKSVTAKSGDIALYDKQEFIFDGTEWNAFGGQSGLGALAYKDTATGTAITTAGTLPTLVYDSTNERFIFNAGTLPTSGTVTVS